MFKVFININALSKKCLRKPLFSRWIHTLHTIRSLIVSNNTCMLHLFLDAFKYLFYIKVIAPLHYTIVDWCEYSDNEGISSLRKFWRYWIPPSLVFTLFLLKFFIASASRNLFRHIFLQWCSPSHRGVSCSYLVMLLSILSGFLKKKKEIVISFKIAPKQHFLST